MELDKNKIGMWMLCDEGASLFHSTKDDDDDAILDGKKTLYENMQKPVFWREHRRFSFRKRKG